MTGSFGKTSSRLAVVGLASLLIVGCGGARPAPTAVDLDPAAYPLDGPPPEPAPRPIAFPAEVARQLSCGLTVVVLPMPATGTVTLRVLLPGGESAEPPERAGLAGLTADALKLGTPTMDAATIARRIEELGTDLSVACGADHCQAKVETLTRNLDATLAILSRMLVAPTFPEHDLEVLEGEWATWLAFQESRTSFVAVRAAHRLLYGDHPYARYAPTPESLDAISRADVVGFHRRAMGPRGAVLVAAGDLDAARFLEAAEAAFRDWRSLDDPLPAVEPVRPPALEPVIHLVDRPGAVQATLLVAHGAMARTDPGYLAGRVADEVLGGGAARRLFLDLREERGLTYGAGSFLEARRLGGHAAATADVRNEKVGEALRALLAHLARLRDEPVPVAELDESTRYLAGSLAISLDHPGQVTGLVARQRLLGLPADEWTSYPARVRAIDAAAVRDAARKIWPEDAGLLILVVGAADVLSSQLEAIRPVKVIPAR